MTVINPSSISGITSITMPSGDGNVLTIHTNDGVERFRIDSSGNVKVGSACTISQDGDVFFTGVCTATTLAGSGANLTALPAANLTGTLPAISGANLTGIAATDNVRTGILDVAGISTFRNTMNVGAAVTISESGIDAVGLGITIKSINGSQLSGRRRININGDMRVAQRGTSAATQDGSGNEGYMTLDRWYILYSSSAGGAATMSQDTEVPTDYSWGRFSKSLKMDVTTADTSVDTNHAITLQYRMEAQDIRNSGWDYTNPNSILSVSFWAKSVKAGTYCVAVNSQDMDPNKDFIVEYTLVANTWKHVEMEIPGDSSLVIDDNTGSGLNFLWALVTGSGRQGTAGAWTAVSGETKYGTSNQVNFYDSTDNNFYLTGVQIEVGKPTVFEHRTFGDELALCQRYYYRLENDGSTTCHLGTMQYYSDNDFFGFLMSLPVEMRAIPTATLSGSGKPWSAGGNANGSFTSLALNKNSKTSLATNGSATSGTGGNNGYATVITLLQSSYIDADAEL